MKLVLVLTVICASTLAGQQVITSDDVVKMVEAGVAQDIIIKTIAELPVQFVLSPDRLIAMKKASVPDEIVRALMAHGHEAGQVRVVPTASPIKPEAAAARAFATFEMGQGRIPPPVAAVKTQVAGSHPPAEAETSLVRPAPPGVTVKPDTIAPPSGCRQ